MRIVNIINEHLKAITSDGLTKENIYTWAAQFNNIAGRCNFPIGVQTLAKTWSLDCDTITAREFGIFDVYFLDIQKEIDFNALDNEVIVDAMIDIAVDFIGRLKSDKRLTIRNINISGESVYDVDNKNLTGVHLKLDLKENAGRCIPYVKRCY